MDFQVAMHDQNIGKRKFEERRLWEKYVIILDQKQSKTSLRTRRCILISWLRGEKLPGQKETLLVIPRALRRLAPVPALGMWK